MDHHASFYGRVLFLLFLFTRYLGSRSTQADPKTLGPQISGDKKKTLIESFLVTHKTRVQKFRVQFEITAGEMGDN